MSQKGLSSYWDRYIQKMGGKHSCEDSISQAGWGTFTFILNSCKAKKSHGWLTQQKLLLGWLEVFKPQKDKGFDPKAIKPDSGSGEEERSDATAHLCVTHYFLTPG